MKTITTKIIIGLLLVLLAVAPGCKTPPDRVAVTSAETVVITVDAAMQAWREQVVAGKATQTQVEAVRSAYNKYYAASLVERDALRVYATANTNSVPLTFTTGLQTAVGAALSAKTDLLNLVTQFLPANKVAALKGLSK